MRRKFHLFRRKYQAGKLRQTHKIKRASRHPFAVPVLTLGLLVLMSGCGYLLLNRNNPVTINPNVVIIAHDKQEQIVSSREPTVGMLLQKLAIRLNEGDVVEPALTTKINQDDFRINIYRAVPVEVVDGDHRTYTFSAASTPRSIAQQAGVIVYPEDAIKTAPVTDFVATQSVGEQVIVDRSTPVTLNIYGASAAIHTHARTVGELLQIKHIALGAGDSVQPDAGATLTPGSQVFVVHKGIKIETAEEVIAMPIQVTQDNNLAYGTSAVRQQGSPGKQLITYQVNTQNGKETGRTVLQTIITVQPVPEIAVQGTNLGGIKGDMALAGIAPADYTAADYIISHESGWCPTKAQGEHSCPTVPDNAYTSYGYGLCQATPGSKMASAGGDWATNPVTQLRWCNGYAVGRYGGWGAAYSHWLAYHNW